MRTIKFRMWHNDTKCMYADTGLTSLGLNDAIEKALKSEYILMQFTGLLDEDEKPIYEGDLFQVAGNIIYEIVFLTSDENGEYMAGFGLKNAERGLSIPIDQFAIVNGKVIGNRYENPELL